MTTVDQHRDRVWSLWNAHAGHDAATNAFVDCAVVVGDVLVDILEEIRGTDVPTACIGSAPIDNTSLLELEEDYGI